MHYLVNDRNTSLKYIQTSIYGTTNLRYYLLHPHTRTHTKHLPLFLLPLELY